MGYAGADLCMSPDFCRSLRVSSVYSNVKNPAGRILNFIFSCCDSDATSELAELMMKSRRKDCSVLKDGRQVCGAIDEPM